MRLPKDVPVQFQFNSRDVIHSAYFPHFRTQMNCVPGMSTSFYMVPTISTDEMRKKTNNDKFNYVLLCNKICGVAHYNMKMNVVVEKDRAAFDAWLLTQKPAIPVKKEEAPAPATANNTPADSTIHPLTMAAYEVNELIARLHNARIMDFPMTCYEPPGVNLRLAKNPYRVYAKSHVPGGIFMGIIPGEKVYSCDIPDPMRNPYFFVVDDDFVIDSSRSEFISILTFVREGFFIGMRANCVIRILDDEKGNDGGGSIGLQTLRDIAANEELIYEAGKIIE